MGDHIVADHCDRTDDRALPDTHMLMHPRQPADDHVIPNDAMPRHSGLVHQNHAVSDLRVMGDMAPGHQQAIGPNTCHAAPGRGSGVNGDMFADDGSWPDLQTAGFALKLFVLRGAADNRERMDRDIRCDRRVARYHNMRV